MEVFFSRISSLQDWDLTKDRINELGLNELDDYEVVGGEIRFPIFYSNGGKFESSYDFKEDYCFAIMPDGFNLNSSQKDMYYSKLNQLFNSSQNIIYVYLHRQPDINELLSDKPPWLRLLQNLDVLHHNSEGSPHFALFQFLLGNNRYKSISQHEIRTAVYMKIQNEEIQRVPDCYKLVLGEENIKKINEIYLDENYAGDMFDAISVLLNLSKGDLK